MFSVVSFTCLLYLFTFILPMQGVHSKRIKDGNRERYEVMDGNGLYLLKWWIVNEEIYFRVTVNTRGTVGLGFSKQKSSAIDYILIWTDDHSGKPHVLDCHKNQDDGRLLKDDTQNYITIDGFQNTTHTQVEFYRKMETCDPYDVVLGSDTLSVLWSFDSKDPINGNLRNPEKMQGSKLMHFLGPLQKKKSLADSGNITQWDVTVNNITIDENMDTLYWCKITKIPKLSTKHHIIGYEPLLSKYGSSGKSLIHHMTLYECSLTGYPGSDASSWDVWVKSSGAVCNSNLLTPRDWDSCITPVATWSIGGSGQFLPQHIGFPIGGANSARYYMLEIHYDNPISLKMVDRSGFRVHYTNKLRENDGGIMITGVSISDTLLIPPRQKLYKNVGICGPSCTNSMFPKNGINIISAAVHTHKAGKKMALRHIRGGKQLDNIVEDSNFNYDYQQTRHLEKEINILPGDYIITECVYDTTNRRNPTFGGYSTKQEMCISFFTYYPKTDLAGCYSMTPVREFFETFGVNQFYSLSMNDIENIFLYNGNILDFLPNSILSQKANTSSRIKIENNKYSDGYDVLYEESLLNKLIISDPIEFHDRTFLSHLNQLPWNETLFSKRVEQILTLGKHMTFCRISNESITIPSEIINYPNYTTHIKSGGICPYRFSVENTSSKLYNIIYFVLILNVFIYFNF